MLYAWSPKFSSGTTAIHEGHLKVLADWHAELLLGCEWAERGLDAQRNWYPKSPLKKHVNAW